jgi:OmpA-OmpF porin, OOP family
VLVRDGKPVPGGHLVDRSFWGWATGSLTLLDRVLVDLAVPVALWQTGAHPFPDLATVSSAGPGDLRVGGRVRLPWQPLQKADLAAGLTVWIPTGARGAFAGDGALRLSPTLIVSGEEGPLTWGASLGLLWRKGQDLGYTTLGSGLAYTAGAAWRHGDWQVGPELYGHFQFEGRDTSPTEILLGTRWHRGAWSIGGGLGGGFDRAPGAAPLRVVTQVSWRPDEGRALRQLEADRRSAERDAAERLAAERLSAEKQAAEQAARAEADRLAAEQAAAKAQADRLAAEQSAAEARAAAQARADAEAARLAQEKAAAERIATQETAHVRLTEARIEILQSIQFESDKDVVRPESEAILKDVAALLATHPEIAHVRIEGHTDASGPVDHNLDLSDRRARAVRRWLVERGGIDAGRLEAKGYGPSKPIADNVTKEGKAKNRRVVFELVK